MDSTVAEKPFVRHSSDAACRVAEDVLEALADSEAALVERLASVEADRDIYRLLAQEGLHALHHQTVTLDRLRMAHYRLLDEYRALRRREQVAA
jgi:hypothetical protein